MSKCIFKNKIPLGHPTDYLEPVQFGCSLAGAQKLVHSVRMAIEANQDKEFYLVKLDFFNAHSEVSCAAVLEELS